MLKKIIFCLIFLVGFSSYSPGTEPVQLRWAKKFEYSKVSGIKIAPQGELVLIYLTETDTVSHLRCMSKWGQNKWQRLLLGKIVADFSPRLDLVTIQTYFGSDLEAKSGEKNLFMVDIDDVMYWHKGSDFTGQLFFSPNQTFLAQYRRLDGKCASEINLLEPVSGRELFKLKSKSGCWSADFLNDSVLVLGTGGGELQARTVKNKLIWKKNLAELLPLPDKKIQVQFVKGLLSILVTAQDQCMLFTTTGELLWQKKIQDVPILDQLPEGSILSEQYGEVLVFAPDNSLLGRIEITPEPRLIDKLIFQGKFKDRLSEFAELYYSQDRKKAVSVLKNRKHIQYFTVD